MPVVADIGSGLLAPDPLLPDEPDAATALQGGAAVVTCSGDKLLGGPQAGLVLGRGDVVERLRRHPLARALRVDKTHPGRAGGDPARPGHAGLGGAAGRPGPAARRAARPSPPQVGGRGGAERRRGRRRRRARAWPCPAGRSALPGGRTPTALRAGDPCVVGRVEHGRCLLDLRCVPRPTTTGSSPRCCVRRACASVATAGHVDHGKSTLVRALTGMEPDRWSEERRRGMTIDLGYAWAPLPSGEVLAFVDVPGHQRFIGNMLAGIGPVPAVLVVVAADEGWRRSPASTSRPSTRSG